MSTQTVRFGSLAQPTLPIGFNGSKQLVLRPWNGSAERHLAELRDKMKEQIRERPMLHLSSLLATLVVQFGDRKLWTQVDGQWKAEMSASDRVNLFDSAWIPDVQVVFFFIRREAFGAEFSNKVNPKTSVTVNIDDFMITMAEGHEQCRRVHKFSRPQSIRGQEASECVVGPARWGAMTALTDSNASSKAYAALFASVVAVPGTKIHQPTASDFDEVPKIELGRLAQTIDEVDVGLDLRVWYDEEDGVEHKTTVQWLHPDFFTDSSPSGTSARSGRTSSRSSTSADSPRT